MALQYTAKHALAALRQCASEDRARMSARFFKTGKGQYGEGDVFLGVTVPNVRKVAKEYKELALPEVRKLLASPFHEARLLGVIIWTMQFSRGNDRVRKSIFDAYIASTSRINNWDLVDVSAPNIVGTWLVGRPKNILKTFARSAVLWERRIAVVATLSFIRLGDPSMTFAVVDLVMHDREDLIHKAAGWMLREVGKHCGRDVLVEYLKPRYSRMPRTMLRYALEHFSAVERRRWLLGKI